MIKRQQWIFLQQHGLLHRQRYCDYGHEMNLHLTPKEDRWHCNTRGCRQQKQLKAGTWFEGTFLKYETIVYFIYWWSKEKTSSLFCFHELSIGSFTTVVDWNNYMREVCAQALLSAPKTIGDRGLHVEVDESLFVRRKADFGRVRTTKWVVGGVCRETNECFLYTVEDRSASMLNSVVEQACRAGSIIITDEWPGYNGISNMPGKNFTHQTVDHSRNFMNPRNGACTNRIEGLWNIAKMRNKQRWGTHRQMVDSYLCEFVETEISRDLAMDLFRSKIIMNDKINSRVLRLLLDNIESERIGNIINRPLLRSVIRMLADLKVYDELFFNQFIKHSEKFYNSEAHTLLAKLSVPDYLDHVRRRIGEEEERSLSYMDVVRSSDTIIATVVSQLLTPHVDSLIKHGLDEPLKARNYQLLSLFYSLLNRVPQGLDKLCAAFRAYIIRIGQEVVDNPRQDPEKDRGMIQTLINDRDYYFSLIDSCFNVNLVYMRAVQESYETFINKRPSKPAEYLAKYIDSYLRSGNKIRTDDELEKLMDKVLVLFRYINGKDVFEAFYTKELAKRLLLNKSASIDSEKNFLSKLKTECGPEFTRKMETMFQDIEFSRQLSKGFRCTQSQSSSIELIVNVICPASWPSYVKTTAIYPDEMLDLRRQFEQFYVSHHKGRRLRYEPLLGMCTVKARFPTSPHIRKELLVSECQALILLQFNDETNPSLSYAQLAESTGILESELKKTLLSLSAGKNQRVLLMKPTNFEIQPQHTFTFNPDFKHKLMRIKFNQVQMKETKQEQESTHERVFADRVANVDCCLVRILKARKSIDHTTLLGEVFQQLRFPLKASDVKIRIESLIERDYMRRDDQNPSLYHYVA